MIAQHAIFLFQLKEIYPLASIKGLKNFRIITILTKKYDKVFNLIYYHFFTCTNPLLILKKGKEFNRQFFIKIQMISH